MLREIRHVNQEPGGPQKSWYTDDFFDLFVWSAEGQGIIAFQLSYDKNGAEKMLSWNQRSGVGHSKVDDGEQHQLRQKASPILVRDGPVADTLAVNFQNASKNIDPEVVRFVLDKLERFARDTSRPTLQAFPAVTSPKNE